jgi:hypothetical protein
MKMLVNRVFWEYIAAPNTPESRKTAIKSLKNLKIPDKSAPVGDGLRGQKRPKTGAPGAKTLVNNWLVVIPATAATPMIIAVPAIMPVPAAVVIPVFLAMMMAVPAVIIAEA